MRRLVSGGPGENHINVWWECNVYVKRSIFTVFIFWSYHLRCIYNAMYLSKSKTGIKVMRSPEIKLPERVGPSYLRGRAWHTLWSNAIWCGDHGCSREGYTDGQHEMCWGFRQLSAVLSPIPGYLAICTSRIAFLFGHAHFVRVPEVSQTWTSRFSDWTRSQTVQVDSIL